MQLVARFRVDDFARALAGCAAGQAADHGARRGADRTGHRAGRRACRRAAGAADALGQVMVVQVVGCLRVHHFARAAASRAARQAAHDGARRHADRAGGRTGHRTHGCAAAGAHALGQVVFRQVVAGLRIHDFADALAGHAAGDGADRRAGHGADRTGGRADACAQHGAAGGAQAGADHVRAAVVGERLFDVARILVRTGVHAHHDAAALDAFFIVRGTVFRDAGADQRADQATGDAAGAGAGQRCGQRAGHDHAQARQDQGGADGGDARQDGADGAADAGADAGAFGCLAAQFSVGVAEVRLARLVGHHEVDVVFGISAGRDRGIGAFCAGTVREQAGDHARILIVVAGGVVAAHVESFRKGQCGVVQRRIASSETICPAPHLFCSLTHSPRRFWAGREGWKNGACDSPSNVRCRTDLKGTGL